MEQPWTHEMLSYDPSSLKYSLVQAVQQGWTTPNSWNVPLWSLFPRLLVSSSSLASFNQPEHIKDYPMILVPLLTGQFEQVYSVALPQTHGKLFYDPCSFHYSVVQADQLCWTTPNSLNILLLSFEQFGCVELPWTHEMFIYAEVVWLLCGYQFT